MSKECIGCRLEWPVVMTPFGDCDAGAYHAVPNAKGRLGREWLRRGNPSCLVELYECTRPRGPVLTLLQGGLP